MKNFFWILFLALQVQALFAQKTEVEKRIPEKSFPGDALLWLNAEFAQRKCLRYYLETDGDITNFEAKFKWQGERYSVEFFKNGVLKDIEKQISFKDIPDSAQAGIHEKLRRDFKQFKVLKVQEQTLPNISGKRYEMEIKGKNDSGTALFEYLFEADGRLVLSRQIILPPNNITLY